MIEARFYDLVESYLADTLGQAERRELEAAVRSDEGLKREFVAQVRVARTLGVLMRKRSAADTWARVERLLAPDGRERGKRLADAVEAIIDRSGARRPRPWPWIVAGAGLAVAASLALVLLRADRPSHLARSSGSHFEVPEQEPAARAPLPIPKLLPPPPPPVVAAAPVAPPTPIPSVPIAATGLLGDREMLAAAEGPALAARADLIFFGAFETMPTQAVWPIRNWIRQQTTALRPGLVGNALHVGYPRGSGPKDGGTRMRIRLAQNFSAPAGRDLVHVRYHIRLDPEFDFGEGGLLPGLCGGLCDRGNGHDGVMVRTEWNEDGGLAFVLEAPGGWNKARKTWTRSLVPGVWHSVELRVKLNTPGKRDGAVVGWLDGERAGEIHRLRLRDVPTLQIDSVFLDTAFRRKQGLGAPRDLGAAFDDVVVAGSYIGPRAVESPLPPSVVAPDDAP